MHRHYECACRRRQAKKNAQAAKSGAAGHSFATSAASQPLTGAHQGASNSRDAPRAYSADLEHYQRANRAIRPVGKLGQAMPAAEAAALLAAVHTFSRPATSQLRRTISLNLSCCIVARIACNAAFLESMLSLQRRKLHEEANLNAEAERRHASLRHGIVQLSEPWLWYMQAANGQPRFALGGATSAFGQYNEASAAGASQHSGSRFPNLAQAPARQPALFKRGPQRQESEESMSQQPQISSSSSDGAGQTAEASAALQSLYNFARSSQQDGASSRAPRVTTYSRPEKIETARPSPAADQGALLYPCLHPEITRIISVSSAALHSNMATISMILVMMGNST